jgi:hypothetical protein
MSKHLTNRSINMTRLSVATAATGKLADVQVEVCSFFHNLICKAESTIQEGQISSYPTKRCNRWLSNACYNQRQRFTHLLQDQKDCLSVIISLIHSIWSSSIEDFHKIYENIPFGSRIVFEIMTYSLGQIVFGYIQPTEWMKFYFHARIYAPCGLWVLQNSQ